MEWHPVILKGQPLRRSELDQGGRHCGEEASGRRKSGCRGREEEERLRAVGTVEGEGKEQQEMKQEELLIQGSILLCCDSLKVSIQEGHEARCVH